MGKPQTCEHGLIVCRHCTEVSDAAKRITAEIMMAVTFLPWDVLAHHCMAFRLDDGTTDRALYPTRKIALSHQLRPCAIFYFRNAMGGVTAQDISLWLALQRLAYENDRIAWVDPESPDIIVSTMGADVMRARGFGRVRPHG